MKAPAFLVREKGFDAEAEPIPIEEGVAKVG